MEDDNLQYDVPLLARLTLHEYLITSMIEGQLIANGVTEDALANVGQILRRGIAFKTTLPDNVPLDAPVFEIQAELLAQFDSLWAKVAARVSEKLSVAPKNRGS